MSLEENFIYEFMEQIVWNIWLCHNLTKQTTTTSYLQLYIPADDIYLATIEEEFGRACAPLQPEAGISSIFQTMVETYFDVIEENHNMLKQLNDMQRQLDGFEDTIFSMSSMVSAMILPLWLITSTIIS